MSASFFEKTNDLTNTFLASSTESLHQIVSILDEILLASGVVLLGWFVGSMIKKGIMKIGDKLKVPKLSDKVGFSHLLEKANIKRHPSRLIGEFAQGYVITIFLIGASNLLGFDQVAEFLDSVIAYIPNILIALVIVLLGTRVADTVSAILENTLKLAHSKAARTMALTAKYIIVSFSMMAVLFQLKIAADLVQVLFTGFIAMIALAGGLAFGLGGKDVVREFLEDLKKVPKERVEEARK